MPQLITKSRQRRHRILRLAAAAAVLTGWVEHATAVSRTWGGLQLSPNYSNGLNWEPVRLNPFDDVFFTHSNILYHSILIDDAVQAGSLFVGNTDYTFYSDGTRSITTPGRLGVDSNATLNISTVTVNAGSLQSFGTVSINDGGALNLNSFSTVNYGRLILNQGGSLGLSPGKSLRITRDSDPFFTSAAQLILNSPWQAPAGTLIEVERGAKIMSSTYFNVINSDLTADGAGTQVIVGNTGVPGSFWSDFGSSASGTATANVSFSNGAFGLYYFGVRMANTGGKAVLTVQSGANLEVRSEMVVGGSGAATVNLNAGYLNLSFASATFESGSTFNFYSGIIDLGFGRDVTFNTGSTWNWAGGDFDTFHGEQAINIRGGTVNDTQVSSSFSLQRKLNITNAGKFLATNKFDLGTCTVLVDGAGSRLTSGTNASDWANATVTFSNGGAGTYSAGLNLGSAGGTVNFNVNSGATFTAGSFLTTGGAAALITLNNGTLTSTGTAAFRPGTTITVSNGAHLRLLGDSTFETGSKLVMNAALDLGIAKTLTFNGGVGSFTGTGALTNGSTLKVIGAGSFASTTWFDIAAGSNSGTLLVDGANARYKVDGESFWGENNAANVTFSNGSVGTVGFFRAGFGVGTATVNVLSGATLNAGTIIAGSATTPLLSSATINVNAGSLIINNGLTARKGTLLTLTSGTLSINGNSTFSGGATLNHVSGSLKIASAKSLTFDGGAGFFASGGGLSGGASLQVLNGGAVTVGNGLTGTYDIGNVVTGNLLVSGPGSYFHQNAFFGSNAWGNGGGSALVNFSDGGVGTFGSLLGIGTGGTASVNLASSAVLYTNGGLTVGGIGASEGVIVLNGGALINTGNMTLRNGAVINYNSGSISAGTIVMSDNALVSMSAGSPKILRAKGLTITGTSKLDLKDNTLVIDYGPGATPISTIRAYLAQGRGANGLWGGTGLTSGTASSVAISPGFFDYSSGLGYVDSPGTSSLTVTYTYTGDANLDYKVDIQDLYALALHFGGTNEFWSGGDFNYDGLTNAFDLAFIARNWQAGTGAPLDAALSFDAAVASIGMPAAVPEPGILGVLTLSLMGTLARRRRV